MFTYSVTIRDATYSVSAPTRAELLLLIKEAIHERPWDKPTHRPTQEREAVYAEYPRLQTK